jgi:hypothetical protein
MQGPFNHHFENYVRYYHETLTRYSCTNHSSCSDISNVTMALVEVSWWLSVIVTDMASLQTTRLKESCHDVNKAGHAYRFFLHLSFLFLFFAAFFLSEQAVQVLSQRGINYAISAILEPVSVLFLQSLCLGHIELKLKPFQHLLLSTSCFEIRLISFHEPSFMDMSFRSSCSCFSHFSHLISIETQDRRYWNLS